MREAEYAGKTVTLYAEQYPSPCTLIFPARAHRASECVQHRRFDDLPQVGAHPHVTAHNALLSLPRLGRDRTHTRAHGRSRQEGAIGCGNVRRDGDLGYYNAETGWEDP